MSYTNVDLVKRHVVAPTAEIALMERRELTLNAVGWVSLTNGAVAEGTVRTLALTQVSPTQETLTFSAATISLVAPPDYVGGVALADNSSQSTVYVGGVDYLIDHAQGTITRLSGGAIAAGASAHLWYFPLQVFAEGVDYDVDYDAGLIRRRSGGAIQSGQRVIVEFTSKPRGVTSDTYAAAAQEANRIVAAAVDPTYDFGADLNLQSAATYTAAAIVCRIAGAAALAGGASGRDAALWLELAASFNADAGRLIDSFKPPRRNLSGPRTN
ncbi:MAG TPA: hypothetical protein VLB27_08330 [candidate division Zixibacteria bacterium]|nr:hypothetical protein [candidate division Zixibacteria bacterium]